MESARPVPDGSASGGGPGAGLAPGVAHRLEADWIRAERIASWLALGLIGAGAIVGSIIGAVIAEGWWAVLLLAGCALVLVVLAWGAHMYPVLWHRHARYLVWEEGIEVRTGWLWHRVTTVARSRVQHTDIAEGPLMRRYGLATLVIYTAGTEYAKVELPGLRKETASRLRDFLIRGGGHDGV